MDKSYRRLLSVIGKQLAICDNSSGKQKEPKDVYKTNPKEKREEGGSF